MSEKKKKSVFVMSPLWFSLLLMLWHVSTAALESSSRRADHTVLESPTAKYIVPVPLRGITPPSARQTVIPSWVYKPLQKCNVTAIHELFVTTRCMPRPDYLMLDSPRTDSYIYPEAVQVDRCAGSCSGMVHCAPVHTENVTIPAILMNVVAGGTLQCATVTIKKHIRCDCTCIRRPTDCSSQQIFNPDSCTCKCLYPDAEQRCLAERRIKKWDSFTCMCSCRQELRCGHPRFFDVNTCDCVTFFPVRTGIMKAMKPLDWRRLPPPP